MKNEIKNSEEFIIKKAGKANKFSVPNDYFKDLDNEIYGSILKNDIGNTNHFKVPSSYFDEFENSLNKKLNPKIKTLSAKEKLIRFIPIAAAASVLLFLGLQTFLFSETNMFNELNENDIEYWLTSENLSSIDIADVLENDIIADNDFAMANINDKNIEEYVLNLDDTSFLNE